MTQLRQKLNRINGLLAKLRYQVRSSLLNTIYFAMQHKYASMGSRKQQYSGHEREHKIKLSE